MSDLLYGGKVERMDPALAGIIGTVAGAALTAFSSHWSAKLNARTSADQLNLQLQSQDRRQQQELQSEARQATQRDLRAHQLAAHQAFLERVDQACADKQRDEFSYDEAAAYYNQDSFEGEARALGLLSSDETMQAALFLVRAYFHTLQVESVTQRVFREIRDPYLNGWGRACRTENEEVERRRAIYLRCARADLGIEDWTEALSEEARKPLPWTPYRDWRDRDEDLRKQALTRLRKQVQDDNAYWLARNEEAAQEETEHK